MITWHDPHKVQPPLFEGVLLAVQGETESSEGHSTGFHSYRFADGHEAVGVYAWAKMPEAPPRATVLKPLRKSKIENPKSKIHRRARA